MKREHSIDKRSARLCSRHFHQSLFLSAAMVAFAPGLATTVHAQSVSPTPQCQISGTTVTCSGDLSGGVEIDGDSGTYTTLIVQDVTSDIAPPSDTEGILFNSSGSDISITSNTGSFSIATTDTHAIHVVPLGGDVTIDHTGNIETAGGNSRGIYVEEADGISVTHTGNITTAGSPYSQGIRVINRAGSTGDVTVTQTGNITTSGYGSEAIYADANGSGDTTVTHVGTIITTGVYGDGIVAGSSGAGTTTINHTGTITTSENLAQGILGFSATAVTINHSGTLTTSGVDSSAIVVSAGAGTTNAINLTASTITADRNGILIQSSGDTTVTISGTTSISGGLNDITNYNTGDDTIINQGTFTSSGDIDLGSGTNAFTNQSGATFNSGNSVDLGAGNTFTNAGIMSPGGSGLDNLGAVQAVETTSITGDFVHESTGQLDITVDADGGINDEIEITGTATINGGTVRVLGVTEAPVGTFDFLDATGGVTGSFDEVIGSLFVDWTINQVGTALELSATAAADNFCEFGQTGNQRSIACIGLDSLPMSDAVPTAVALLANGEQARAAFDDLSGEIHASLQGAIVENNYRRMYLLNNRIRNERFDGAGNIDFETDTPLDKVLDGRNNLWGMGYGSWSRTFGTNDTASMDNNMGGLLFGYDRQINNEVLAGIVGGWGRSNVSQDARESVGSADTWSLGLYGEAERDKIGVQFTGIYNWHWLETRRYVDFSTLDETERSDYTGRGAQLYAEANYDLGVPKLEGLNLEPFFGASYIVVRTDGTTEIGGEAALTTEGNTLSTYFTSLGMRGAYNFNEWFNINAALSWRHAYGDTGVGLIVALEDSTAFGIAGAPISSDALELEAGLDIEIKDNILLNAAYEGQFGNYSTIHAVEADFTIRF